MTSFNWKRIVATGAMSGALSLAALGFGAGAANADDDVTTPLLPGGASGDWQQYLPLLGSVGSFVDLQKLGVPPEYANLGNLPTGQLQSILSLAGG
jgi:hypothetical protein